MKYVKEAIYIPSSPFLKNESCFRPRWEISDARNSFTFVAKMTMHHKFCLRRQSFEYTSFNHTKVSAGFE